MVMAMRGERYDSVHGYEVLRSEVVHLLAMLRRKDLKGRREIAGLNPERADIILAGVTVVDELMRFLDTNVLRVNERGIREGLILRGLQRHGLVPQDGRPRDWRSAVLDFARSCQVDEAHTRQVAALALQVFDALAAPFGLDERARRLLEAAALLHDVGYFIGYSGHHKHSYHLIRHARLFGFTPREQEIVANIARYHRKALPKKKHENFVHLAAEDQELVRRLGGILRLADGLDRRRAGLVREVRCRLGQGEIGLTLQRQRRLVGGAVRRADQGGSAGERLRPPAFPGGRRLREWIKVVGAQHAAPTSGGGSKAGPPMGVFSSPGASGYGGGHETAHPAQACQVQPEGHFPDRFRPPPEPAGAGGRPAHGALASAAGAGAGPGPRQPGGARPGHR